MPCSRVQVLCEDRWQQSLGMQLLFRGPSEAACSFLAQCACKALQTVTRLHCTERLGGLQVLFAGGRQAREAVPLSGRL